MSCRSRNLKHYYRPTDPNDHAAALIKSVIHRLDDERHARRHAAMTCMICIPVAINYGRIGQYLKLWDCCEKKTNKQTLGTEFIHAIKQTQLVEFFDKIFKKRKKKVALAVSEPGTLR